MGKAKITLNDCLACSGCITSAESVLITQQSQQELYKVLKENVRLQQVTIIVVFNLLKENVSLWQVNIKVV